MCSPRAKITLSSFLHNDTFKNAKFLPSFIVSALITTFSPIFAEAKYLEKKTPIKLFYQLN